MSLILKATEYKTVHNGYAYAIRLGYKDRGWIVSRRRVDAAPIPPATTVWTEKGWSSMLSTDSHMPKLFETAVAASRMIEEQTDD